MIPTRCHGRTRTGTRCHNTTTRHPLYCRRHTRLLTIGAHAKRWIETTLTHGEGEYLGHPFTLDPWETLAIHVLYQHQPPPRRPWPDHPIQLDRIIERALLELPKGAGKTPFVAAVMLNEFVGPSIPMWYPPGHPLPTGGEAPRQGVVVPEINPSPSVPIAAASYEQADNLYGAARLMVEGNDGHGRLLPYLEVFDKEIQKRDGPGKLYRVPAAGGKLDGGLPSALARDETHEWLNAAQTKTHDMLQQNAAKRRFQGGHCLEIDLSTPGSDLDSLLGKKHQYAEKVRTGEIDDPHLLYLHYGAADPVDVYAPADLRRALNEAYPSTFVDIEQIAAMWERPGEDDDAIPEWRFRRYFLGQWTKQDTQWLPTGAWENRTNRSIVPQARDAGHTGDEITLGFDGSYNRDSTALVACRTSDLHVWPVAIWEKPQGQPKWQVPRLEVDARVSEMFDRFRVRQLACDPFGWATEIEEWEQRWGDRVMKVPTNSAIRMTHACSKMYTAVVGETMTHSGDPVLSRHIANAVTREIPEGVYVRSDRHDSPRKIDGAVAAILALDAATLTEPAPQYAISFV